MRILRQLAFLVLTAAIATAAQGQEEKLARYVDPFLGTGGHGHTYPGATVPFGMVQLSPDNGRTGWDWCSGYHYSETNIVGFSHTHLSGTGCADLGDISFMPTTSQKSLDGSYRSPFTHVQEYAEPGYYRVRLLDHDILVELTASERAGFHRYTFPRTDSAMVMIDLKRGQEDVATDTYLKVESPTLVTGYRFSRGWAADQRVFFAAKFSRPIQEWHAFSSGQVRRDSGDAHGTDVRAMLAFGAETSGRTLLVKVGVSSVSAAQALKNLDAEIPGWGFDRIRAAASMAWERELRKVRVKSNDEQTKKVFYTSLYHACLAPTVFSDVDGQYRGADGKIHTARGSGYYSTYSLWDTYRAAHPLYTIVARERVDGLVGSMLAFAHESGYLPVWQLAANETNTMVGYHAVPVIADAYLKGFHGFNAEDAFEAMRKSATRNHRGVQYLTEAVPESSVATVTARQSGPAETALPEKGQVVAGYARSLGGESIRYHSTVPAANKALLTRATDGKKAISWETAHAPVSIGPDPVSFAWIAGVASGKGPHRFTLYWDEDSVLSFSTGRDGSQKSWTVPGRGDTRLSFEAMMTDGAGDLFGNMVFTLPASICRPGLPLKLRLVGEAGNSDDWCLMFEYGLADRMQASSEYGLYKDKGTVVQLVKFNVEHLGGPVSSVVILQGTEPQSCTLRLGENTVYVPIPAVERLRHARASVLANGKFIWSDTVAIRPVKPYGYVPADRENESVSKSLEYAIDDFAIARMADAMGKEKDAEIFTGRAHNYRNVFDSTTGFMRGRQSDGSWVTPFNPRFSTEKQPEYTEGNAWQYLWLVPQDVPGLVALLGGPEKFDRKLDSLFTQSSDLAGTGAPADVSGLIGLYAQGNEPSHHIAYLYDYIGKPWKTQAMVQRIMREFYKTGPEGLCGNEDCGQMSAWYVLSAMGFYPVTPVGGVYALGSPRLERTSIEVGKGKAFRIETRNWKPDNIYIQSAALNGKPLKSPWITHSDIMKGGKLLLIMGAKPNTAWGSSPQDMPPAVITASASR